jgi:hypothetical protein
MNERTYYVDLLVEDLVVVEVKRVTAIVPVFFHPILLTLT